MRNKKYLWTIASFLSVLIISLPITLAQEINYVTDANGNLVTGDSFYREYNEFNQLIRIHQGNISTGPILEEYEWHPTEERILIKDVFSNGVKNYTVYYVSKEYIVIENSTGNYTEEYIYQNGILVAQVNTGGQKQAIHTDYEGSNTLITASDGSVVENTFYSPFGEIIEGGKNSRYSYEGKEYDALVDDIDFKFRKYNPKIPIYNQPDDRINPYDPQQLNRYMFERGNPYRHKDPEGHQILDLIVEVLEFVNKMWEGNFAVQEDRKKDEERLYTKLYEEYSMENPSVPNDPYKNALVSAGPGKAEVVRIRRIDIDELKRWKEQQLERKMQAEKYISSVEGRNKGTLDSTLKNLGQMPSNPTLGTYTSDKATITQPSFSTGAYSSGRGGFTYTIYYDKKGQITGGSTGSISFSSGFAKLFSKVMSSQKKSGKK